MDRPLLLHVAVLLGLTALAVSAAQSAEPPQPDSARQQALVHLVRQDCGSCHGMRLTADELTAALVATIIHGRPGTAMPGWERFLNESEAGWIVARLKQGFPPLD